MLNLPCLTGDRRNGFIHSPNVFVQKWMHYTLHFMYWWPLCNVHAVRQETNSKIAKLYYLQSTLPHEMSGGGEEEI